MIRGVAAAVMVLGLALMSLPFVLPLVGVTLGGSQAAHSGPISSSISGVGAALSGAAGAVGGLMAAAPDPAPAEVEETAEVAATCAQGDEAEACAPKGPTMIDMGPRRGRNDGAKFVKVGD